jgi:hypothetical protein
MYRPRDLPASKPGQQRAALKQADSEMNDDGSRGQLSSRGPILFVDAEDPAPSAVSKRSRPGGDDDEEDIRAQDPMAAFSSNFPAPKRPAPSSAGQSVRR